MKNLSKLLLITLLSVVFLSCSDDDGYDTADLNGLYARADVQSISVKTNNSDVTAAIIAEINEKSGTENHIYFNGIGSGVYYDMGISYISEDANFEDLEEDKFRYYFEGNKLHLIYSADSRIEKIDLSSVSINGFKMHIDLTEFYKENLNNYERKYGLETNSLKITSIKYTIVYTKISENQP